MKQVFLFLILCIVVLFSVCVWQALELDKKTKKIEELELLAHHNKMDGYIFGQVDALNNIQCVGRFLDSTSWVAYYQDTNHLLLPWYYESEILRKDSSGAVSAYAGPRLGFFKMD